MTNRSVLLDLPELSLTSEDKELLQHPSVAGVILFTRNYADQQQLLALTREIQAQGRRMVIAVDHEGGRVQRFTNGFTKIPAMRCFGEQYRVDKQAAVVELQAAISTMVKELLACGVNVTLAPVLDVEQGISDIIGERSFSDQTSEIIALAKVVCDTMHAFGMPTIGKHFPGHGGVVADSHTDLPVDPRSLTELEQLDLKPFVALVSDLDAIMPAHVQYSEVDDRPAGYSPVWLQEILRKQLKFNGVIISDDLTMAGAASLGSYEDRAFAALEAGCDLVCVCQNRAGAIEVLESLERYNQSAVALRIEQYLQKLPRENATTATT